MRRIPLRQVKPGMVVGRDILDSLGNVLLGKGVTLTLRYIKRLEEIEVTYIDIYDKYLEDVEIPELLTEKTKNMAMKAITDVMGSIKLGNLTDTFNLKASVNNIIDEIISDPNVTVGLSDIRTTDNYTFAHCVNVSALSVLTGISLGYNKTELYDLGLGAILHDVGKIKIPKEIIDKPAKLTHEEMKVMELHTQHGFDIVRKELGLSSVAAHIAFQHHERYDGSGYPRGLKGNEIHKYARVAVIADVYDAITADRIYRKSFLPHQAVEYILAMSNTQFDFELAKTFVKRISIFPIGTYVVLTTGERGLVLKTNVEFPTRPVVRVVYNNVGNLLDKPVDVDLSSYPKVLIESVWEDFDPQNYVSNI